MSTKKYKPEQIVNLLRQIEVEIANGKTTPQACRDAGITAQTYYRWRKEFGGLKLDQAKRLKELEEENSRLKRLVADLTLDKAMLQEVLSKKSLTLARKHELVDNLVATYRVSIRTACKVLSFNRTSALWLSKDPCALAA